MVKLFLCVIGIVMLMNVSIAPDRQNTERAREAVLKENLFRIRDAIDQYRGDKNQFPTSLQLLVTEKYLREIPKDSITDSADTWKTVVGGPGIRDVKSGAKGASLDRSKYSDW